MKNRTVLVTSLLAFVLAIAPVMSAAAGGRHGGGHYGGGYYGGGGHYGGGPFWGFAGAIVATAAAVITAPIAIAAAVAQAPLYYPPGPAYAGAPPVYYNTPTAGPGSAATPAYHSPPQVASYYAPASPQPQGEWYYCANSNSYYPYVRDCPAGWQRVPAQPPPS